MSSVRMLDAVGTPEPRCTAAQKAATDAQNNVARILIQVKMQRRAPLPERAPLTEADDAAEAVAERRSLSQRR